MALKIKVKQRQGDAVISLPPLPDGEAEQHQMIFDDHDHVIFAIFIWRFDDRSVKVDLMGPDDVEPVTSATFSPPA